MAKNKYTLPLEEKDIKRIDRTSSPAHVGKLKNSVDFACSEGTPIHASRSGRVVFVKDDSQKGGPDKRYWDDGNRIVIAHDNGEYTAYEHLRYQGTTVRVGDNVRKRQRIGYSGNTGYTFAPHLHFEVLRFTGPNKKEDYETLEVHFPGEGRLKKPNRDITSRLAIVSVSSLIISFGLISSNFAGNVVINLSKPTSNLLGVILLILGLVTAVFYFKFWKISNLSQGIKT